MSKIGAFEASTRCAKLRDAEKVRSAIAGLKVFQETHSLDGLSVRRIIEDARQY